MLKHLETCLILAFHKFLPFFESIQLIVECSVLLISLEELVELAKVYWKLFAFYNSVKSSRESVLEFLMLLPSALADLLQIKSSNELIIKRAPVLLGDLQIPWVPDNLW